MAEALAKRSNRRFGQVTRATDNHFVLRVPFGRLIVPPNQVYLFLPVAEKAPQFAAERALEI